jgi:phosphatidylserine decarboxylase
MLSSMGLPIHKDGWKFILIFAFVSLVLAYVSSELGWIGALLTGWCVYFFRDPDRVTPQAEGAVISPADGVVSAIGESLPPKELGLEGEEKWTRISIFLNVFDVHVNRIPLEGVITKSVYHPGKFFNASLDKASEYNERQSLMVQTASGQSLIFVQIAGLIARRILCEVIENQQVKAGERFGLIRFGSRVDVYLPQGIAPQVLVGQRMISGETILAHIKAS